MSQLACTTFGWAMWLVRPTACGSGKEPAWICRCSKRSARDVPSDNREFDPQVRGRFAGSDSGAARNGLEPSCNHGLSRLCRSPRRYGSLGSLIRAKVSRVFMRLRAMLRRLLQSNSATAHPKFRLLLHASTGLTTRFHPPYPASSRLLPPLTPNFATPRLCGCWN